MEYIDCVDPEYVIDHKAKTYGAGKKLIELVKNGKKTDKLQDHNLSDPYIPGNTNEHFMKDIRVAVFRNMTPEKIVELCLEKFEERPIKNRRSEKDIYRAIELWHSRNDFIDKQEIAG